MDITATITSLGSLGPLVGALVVAMTGVGIMAWLMVWVIKAGREMAIECHEAQKDLQAQYLNSLMEIRQDNNQEHQAVMTEIRNVAAMVNRNGWRNSQ